jgi:hypothetical protein
MRASIPSRLSALSTLFSGNAALPGDRHAAFDRSRSANGMRIGAVLSRQPTSSALQSLICRAGRSASFIGQVDDAVLDDGRLTASDVKVVANHWELSRELAEASGEGSTQDQTHRPWPSRSAGTASGWGGISGRSALRPRSFTPRAWRCRASTGAPRSTTELLRCACRGDETVRHLMSAPPDTRIETRARFASSAVGAFPGMTPRRYQSPYKAGCRLARCEECWIE